MSIKISKTINETSWKKLDHSGSPFLDYNFFHTLEQSGVIGGNSGWNPLYFEEPNVSILYTFEKSHSYGEYIFDWDWANGFHQHNTPYYPKLTSMIPFTPATTSHFIGSTSTKIMDAYETVYKEKPLSSSHFLFLQEEELDFFKSYKYIIRDSLQYHFSNNDYQSFEDFLTKLKSKKAKQVKKERIFEKEISFKGFTGEELNESHAIEMFQFYQKTLLAKQAISYLNLDFFVTIFKKLKNNIYYMQATRKGHSIAGSLFFYNSNTLYGRYWGANEEVQNLHFELCYYQGIDFCIKNKIKTFEAGAQGEHKIARGFCPVKTYSAHKVKHPEFNEAISNYISNEREQLNKNILYLNERQPFKTKV